jgi:hypothetical protein
MDTFSDDLHFLKVGNLTRDPNKKGRIGLPAIENGIALRTLLILGYALPFQEAFSEEDKD